MIDYCRKFRQSPELNAEGNYFLTSKKNYKKAYAWFKKAVQIRLPKDVPFVERSIYTWASLYNLAVCAEELGITGEVKKLRQELLLCPELPQKYREVIEKKLIH